MMFIIVDLPEPDVPMMAIDEPGSIVRSTPRSAWTRLSPITYVRSMPRISTSAVTGCLAGLGWSWCSLLERADLAVRPGGRADDLGDELVARLKVALDHLGRRAVGEA